MAATLLLSMLHLLGLALLHSCWQFGIAWLVFHALLATGSPLSPGGRHALALRCLGIGLLLAAGDLIPGTPWYLFSASAAAPLPAFYHSPLPLAVIDRNWWHQALVVSAVVYLLSVSIRCTRLWLFSARALWMPRHGLPEIDPQWETFIRTMSVRLGIARRVRVLLSEAIDTPQIVGIFRPVILVPFACLSGLSTVQLEAILIHELAHIRRQDYALNLLLANLEAIFFFNPFVRQLAATIRMERELCCDDTVLKYSCEPHSYAQALFSLEKNRSQAWMPGIAASGNQPRQLLARIARITGAPARRQPAMRRRQRIALVALIGVTILLLAPPSAPETPRDTYRNMPLPRIADQSRLILNPPLAADAVPPPGQTRRATVNAPAPRGLNPAALQPVASAERWQRAVLDGLETAPVLAGIHFEKRQFSLPSPAYLSGQPQPLTGYDAGEPYVPATVLEYHLIPDSTIPAAKGKSLAEAQAEDALLQTRKAIDELDWKAIGQRLRNKSTDIAGLKKELLRQLEAVDWQRLNRETLLEKQAMAADRLKQALEMEQQVRIYEQNEALFESFSKQFAEQQQLLREQELRLENLQPPHGAEGDSLKIVLKKKRIIAI